MKHLVNVVQSGIWMCCFETIPAESVRISRYLNWSRFHFYHIIMIKGVNMIRLRRAICLIFVLACAVFVVFFYKGEDGGRPCASGDYL